VQQTAPPTPAPASAVLFADTAETVAVPGPAAAPEDRLAALVVAARRLAAARRHGGFGGVPPAADADADDGCGGGAWGGGGAGGGGGGADCAAGLQLRPLLQLRLRWRLLPPPPCLNCGLCNAINTLVCNMQSQGGCACDSDPPPTEAT
jgi:hypothetical protein